jgi:hypothetical protein
MINSILQHVIDATDPIDGSVDMLLLQKILLNEYNPSQKFKVGDRAYKPKGYKFPCTIVSVFKTTEGEVRIVGEMEDNGMLHIFNENQLEHYDYIKDWHA